MQGNAQRAGRGSQAKRRSWLLVLVPIFIWACTAAPSFYSARALGLERVKYSGKNADGKGLLFSRSSYRSVIDSAIEDIYLAIRANELHEALRLTDRILADFPNFHLAHMLRGDILSLKSGRAIAQIGDIPDVPSTKLAELEDLRQEAMVRFKAVDDRPKRDLLPAEIVELDNTIKHIVLVDTARSRLFLYENAFPTPRLVTDFYVSQGKLGAIKSREGDKRTPIGVYTITELLPKERLSDFYGPIALPIDYPNSWDKRQGKTGSGIWLHGIPKQYVSRPPRSSDGCVVLANQDLLALKQFIEVGNTQVIIAERLEFIPINTWKEQRKAMVREIKTWRDDLQYSLDRAINHYHPEAIIDGKNLETWQQSLIKHTGGNSLGRVKVHDITITRYPNETQTMMLVQFTQEDEVFGEIRKRQYWADIEGNWKILQEDSEKS